MSLMAMKPLLVHTFVLKVTTCIAYCFFSVIIYSCSFVWCQLLTQSHLTVHTIRNCCSALSMAEHIKVCNLLHVVVFAGDV